MLWVRLQKYQNYTVNQEQFVSLFSCKNYQHTAPCVCVS
jgi:hypothetical protein